MIPGIQKTPLLCQLASMNLTMQAVIYKLSQLLISIFTQILLSFDRIKKKGVEILNNALSNNNIVKIKTRN